MGEVLKDIFQGGEYSTDKNLSRLFSDQVVYAEFWISKLSVGGRNKLNLCYGLISEARTDTSTEWRKSDFKSVISGIKVSNDLSYKIAKISIVNSGRKISKFIDELLIGKNFKEACERSELPVLDGKFQSIQLIKSKKMMFMLFVHRLRHFRLVYWIHWLNAGKVIPALLRTLSLQSVHFSF